MSVGQCCATPAFRIQSSQNDKPRSNSITSDYGQFLWPPGETVGQEMREALSIISSATLLPLSAASPGQSAGRRRHSSSTTTKTPRKPNPKCKPQFATIPLISHSRWDNRQSLRYHAELASKLAEDGRLEDFLMIAETVVASGVDPSKFSASLNRKNVSSGFARVLGEGKLVSVVKLLRGSRKLGIEPVHLLDAVAMESLRGELSRLLKYGHLEQLLSSLEILSGFRLPIKELVKPSDVINLCISKRDPTAAVRYAQNFSHVEMLVCSIILEFGKKRDLASALIAFEESRKKLGSPNMHVYRTIIDACGLCGDYLKSRTIFEELLAGNVTPNTYVLNSLMNVNAYDLDYTLGIFKKMEKLNVKADVASHNILLKSCCLASKVDLAHDIYKMMRMLESEGVLKLDVFTYSSMIKVFADAKMWKPALEIKEDMVTSGVTPNTIAWSSLISACANAGLVEKAINLFNEMLECGGQPNSQCFNILLHACVEACQFDRAFRLFQCWKETDFPHFVTDDSVNNSGEHMEVDQMRLSLRTYSHLTAKIPFRPTTSTYNIMMKACGTNYYRAKALMDEMKTLGLFPNQISWSILIDICGGSGNVTEAVQILKTMREAGIQPDVIAYTTAIKICVEHKDPKLAYNLYAEMKRYRVTPNMVTYNTILRARSRYGSLQEVQQCLALYQHMRKAGYKPNDYYLKQLIEEWCEGVIQNEQQHKGQLPSRAANLGPQSLLLEKVAVYLQDSNNDSISIDLRGLSKLEGRIMVLAVLRMIKENYAAGNPIQEHVSVILGLQEQSPYVAKDESGVREAVIRLLERDLGLKVLETSSSPKQALESTTRRPMVPQKLKVTRESLHQWLQRTGPMQTSS